MSNEVLIQYTPPTNVDYSKYTNIMFIHSDVEIANFSSYCNDDTYPLVNKIKTSREVLVLSFPTSILLTGLRLHFTN